MFNNNAQWMSQSCEYEDSSATQSYSYSDGLEFSDSSNIHNIHQAPFEAEELGIVVASGDAPNANAPTPSASSYQSTTTLQWLATNFIERDSVSISRSTIYDFYLKFCEQNRFSAVCKASFGKLIRSKFLNVKSKRLGARGQSKYHYYNISFRDSRKRCIQRLDSANVSNSSSTFRGNCDTMTQSELLQLNLNEQREDTFTGLTIFSTCEANSEFFSFNLSEGDYHGVIQTMLSFMKVPLEEPLTESRAVFINLYRIHCQCIIDAALSGNFTQMYHYLVHFWQQLPVAMVNQEVMTSMDSKMVALLEQIYLTNIDALQWQQIRRLNTITRLIPKWLNTLFKTLPEIDEEFAANKQRLMQSLAVRVQFKTEFLVALEKISNLDHRHVIERLQLVITREIASPHSLPQIQQNFASFLSSLQSPTSSSASFARRFIDALDQLLLKHLQPPNSPELPRICSQILFFLNQLNRELLEDSLLSKNLDYEDIDSDEEFDDEFFDDDSVDCENRIQSDNDIRLFLFTVESYLMEVCQHHKQQIQHSL